MTVEERKNSLDQEGGFTLQKRRLLVVWVYSLKSIKNLNSFGKVMYVSRRMKYALIYLNEEKLDEVEQKIRRFHFVRHTERSYRPDVEMNFSDKVGTKALKELSKESENVFDTEEFNKVIRLVEDK